MKSSYNVVVAVNLDIEHADWTTDRVVSELESFVEGWTTPVGAMVGVVVRAVQTLSVDEVPQLPLSRPE